MGLLIKKNDLFPNVPSFFDDFINGDVPSFNTVANGNMPAVNIKETEDRFEIEVAAPGFDKADFHIEVDNNMLHISTEKENKTEEKDDSGKYTRREFSYRSFKRSFSLPKDVVDSEKIEAQYKDGILNIVLPKREEVKPKPSKRISIK